MRVFISWSGDRSKQFAEALRPWLRRVMNNVQPWLSRHDLFAGSKWPIELANELESTDVGIICLTRENLTQPWLLFEAGALSKKTESRVMPLLMDGSLSEVNPPLSHFQAAMADEKGIFNAVRSINDLLNSEKLGHSPEELLTIFNKWFPDLDKIIKKIPETPAPVPDPISPDEMLRKIMDSIQEMNRRPMNRGISKQIGTRGIQEAYPPNWNPNTSTEPVRHQILSLDDMIRRCQEDIYDVKSSLQEENTKLGANLLPDENKKIKNTIGLLEEECSQLHILMYQRIHNRDKLVELL